MDNTKHSFAQNQDTLSGASLDRAFVLSSNDSLLINIANDSEITIDKSLLGEGTDSKEIRNTDNAFSDSTSYLVFPNTCTIFNKLDAKGPTVCSETNVSDSVDESCNRDSGGESDTEGSTENVKNTTLSKVLMHMIETILKTGSNESNSTKKVITNYSSPDQDTDKLGSNICHSRRNKGIYFSPLLESAAPLHAVNEGKDLRNIDSSSKLITILECSDESTANLSKENSLNWSRMYLGKLRSFTPPNNIICDNVKRETYIQNDSPQNESINGSRSSGIETSQSFETHDDYFDTIDSSIHQYVEESGSEYASASELSSTEERSCEITNDIVESTFDDYSEQSITTKISKKIRQISFDLINNGNPQTSFISSGLKSKSRENKKEISKPMKSFLTPLKKKSKTKKGSSESLTDIASIHATSYDTGDKHNTCTPIRRTKYYAQQKTPKCTQNTKKNTPTSQIPINNSPRLSNWRSPAVITSSIRPVKFLRNLFYDIEKKNRGLGRPPTIRVKKIAKPMIFVTPASPL